MNRIKITVLAITALLIGVFLGLETTHTDYQEPLMSSIDLCVYGRYIGSDAANPPYPPLGRLAYAGNYKYHLIGAVVLICAALEVGAKIRKRKTGTGSEGAASGR